MGGGDATRSKNQLEVSGPHAGAAVRVMWRRRVHFRVVRHHILWLRLGLQRLEVLSASLCAYHSPRTLRAVVMDVQMDLGAAIAEAAGAIHQPQTLDGTLAAIAAAVRISIPGFDQVGISSLHPDGRVETRAATSTLVLELDKTQSDFGEGPCIDTLLAATIVAAPRPRDDQRWPQYVPAAIERGVRSQLALRLHLDSHGTLGSLNLYSTTSECIDPEAEVTADLFATYSAKALAHAGRSRGAQAHSTAAAAVVPNRPDSIPAVRVFLSRLLSGWGLADEIIDDASLLATELLSNAVRHGTGRVALRVEVEDGVVQVRVHDDHAKMPVVEDADLTSVRGRGLFIVECLADQWGIHPDERGKTLWFRLKSPMQADD
jgi:anti-sigma regulatory factor (Ser/Thr protein kinase)